MAGTSPLTERTVEIGGVRSRVVEAAGHLGPPMLFLHGFGDTASTWRRVQRRLAEHGVASMAVDQPGHGQAGPPEPDRPLVDQMVAFARAAAETFDDAPIVVGNSLGGAHALLLAARHPGSVRAVAALSPAALDHPRWMRRGAAAVSGGAARGRPVGRIVPPAMAGAAVSVIAFGRPWRAPAPMRRDWNQRMADPAAREALRSVALRVGEEYLATPLPLGDIEAPVLVLWGDRDRLTLISSRRLLEREVADLHFVPLPGIGHMPQLEAPGRTTKHLLGLHRRLRAS